MLQFSQTLWLGLLLNCCTASPPIEDRVDNERVRRRLDVSLVNIDDESYCWEDNTGFHGVELQVLEKIPQSQKCQQECRAFNRCSYFSYAEITQLCVLYHEVLSLKDSAGVVSGPKDCPQGSVDTSPKIPPSMSYDKSRTQFGQLVTPAELLAIINQNTKEDNNLNLRATSNSDSVAIDSLPLQESVATPATYAASPGTPYLGNIVSNILGSGPLGILNGLASIVANGGNNDMRHFVEGAPAALTSGIQNAETLFAAGNTFLKTIPLSDLIRAGSDLFTNINPTALRDGVQGGVTPLAKNKETATSPPSGVDAPEVTCLSEGMKCCVPRNAAPRYQTNPPKLNGVSRSRCAATYSSSTDQLCVTTKYVDDECETTILETSDYLIYRNIMELPGKTMNNAICECLISKRSVQPDLLSNQIATEVPTISGNGRWQYSLAALDNQNQAHQRIVQALDRFQAGTDLASKVTTTYANNLNKAGVEGASEQGQVAADVIDVLGELTKSFKTLV